MRQLKIDPEFRDKIPPSTKEEFNLLEESIVREGRVRDPLIVWNDTIIDGHNRYAIIQMHPEVKWEVRDVEFSDRYEAIVWICKNQLGRRNLTEEQKSYLRGKQYEAEKMAQGGTGANQYTKEQTGQNVHLPTRRETKDGTAGRIGKQYGVNGRTIRRDADFAKGVDLAEEEEPGLRNKILSGETQVSKTVVASFPAMPKEERKAILSDISNGKKPEKRKSTNPDGYPKERRELNKTIADVVSTMYDTERVVEHTADDLIEDLTAIINDFTGKVKRSLQNHSTLLQDEATRKRATAALSEAEAAISKMKGLIL